MSMRPVVAFAVALAMVGSCTVSRPAPDAVTPSANSTSNPPPGGEPTVEPPPSRPPTPPIDPSISPVSASHPSSDAKEALDACGAYEFGLDHVAGVGLIPHATDAPRFGLSAAAPLLKVATPAWVIQFRGEMAQLRSGETWIDPTCVVIDREPAFYATGPVRSLATGKIVRGYWPDPATASVPPLDP